VCLSPKKQEYRRESKLDFRVEFEFTTNLQLMSPMLNGVQSSMRIEREDEKTVIRIMFV
jgi:hypothetical protein